MSSSDPYDNRISKSPKQVAEDASPSDPQTFVTDEGDHLDDAQFLPPIIKRTSRMLPLMFASDEEDDSPLNLTININTKPRRSVSDSQLIVFKPNVGEEKSCASDEISDSIIAKTRKKRNDRNNRSRNLLRRLSSLLHRKEKKISLDYQATNAASDVHDSKDSQNESGSSEDCPFPNASITSYDVTTSKKRLESNSHNISKDGYAFRDVPTMQSMSSISFSQASNNCNSILDQVHDEDNPIQDKAMAKNGSRSSKTQATVSTGSSGFLFTCMDSAIDTFSEGVSCCKSSIHDR